MNSLKIFGVLLVLILGQVVLSSSNNYYNNNYRRGQQQPQQQQQRRNYNNYNYNNNFKNNYNNNRGQQQQLWRGNNNNNNYYYNRGQQQLQPKPQPQQYQRGGGGGGGGGVGGFRNRGAQTAVGSHWSTAKSFSNNQQHQFPNLNKLRSQFPDYEFTGLTWINRYRTIHQAQGMSLDQELVQRAQQCAEYYANMGVINHSCKLKSGAGENLYMVHGSRRNSVRAADATKRAVESWYTENSRYKSYNKHPFTGADAGTGHFTQLVWKSSRRLGIGVATVGGKTCVVALFYPPGNYYGRFQNNVLPPSKKNN